MNASEITELVKVLSQAGATHFKSHDFEVTLKESKGVASVLPQEQLSVPVQENTEATQKLKDLIGTLNLPDSELVERMFPNGGPV